MATVITKTVKPGGGDYTLLSSAIADVPADLQAVDEQWDIICSSFGVSGLDDSISHAISNNADSTHYFAVIAAEGDEYNSVTGEGFLLHYDSGGSGATLYYGANTSTYQRLINIGVRRSNRTDQRTAQLISSNITVTGCSIINDSNNRAALDMAFSSNSLFENNLIIQDGTFASVNCQNGSGSQLVNNTLITTGGGDGVNHVSGAVTFTNNLYLGAGEFTVATNYNAASDYNASEGLIQIGLNSLINRTTADVVDFAGGDFRTALSSALATAGNGTNEDFIGFALESGGGGITVTPNTINSSSVSLDPVITFKSVINLTPTTINSSSVSLDPVLTFESALNISPPTINSLSIALDPVIEFNSVLNLSPSTINSSSVSLDPTISFSAALNLTPNTINSSSVSLDPVITYSSTLELTPQTINSSSVALNPVIDFTSALIISPQTINSSSISLDPIIEFKSVIDLAPDAINSLSISLNPILSFGEVQVIGEVTASFKDSGISVEYKPDGITVTFK